MSFLRDNTKGENIGWKASAKALFIPAIVTALVTITLTFGILMPLRNTPEERTEVTVAEVLDRLKRVEDQLADQIAASKKEVRQHRVHSCAQHAVTFLASLDPDEVDQFNKKHLRQAFSLCPKELQFDKVMVDRRHGGQTPHSRGRQPDSDCLPYIGRCNRTKDNRGTKRERPKSSALPETK